MEFHNNTIRPGDGYYWKNDLPVFNFSLAKGKKGLIFINFDILNIENIKINLTNTSKDKCITIDYFIKEIPKYKPEKNINDLYFIGASSSNYTTQIREKLVKESKPFNVNIITDYANKEPLYKMKDHKYLSDLCGWKPWSLRLKFLFLLDRIPIRISFYNSNIGETDYFNQYFDYIFKENIDYIHLKYDYDYTKPISDKLYNTIKKNIINIYNFLESNPNIYIKMINNIKKKQKYLSIENSLKYLEKIINTYTDTLLER